jgi:phenylalanine-4-hydroxylase
MFNRLSTLPAELEPFNTTQQMDAYKESAHQVWRIYHGMTRERIQRHPDRFLPVYRRGFDALSLSNDHVPTLDYLTRQLRPTGWQVMGVTGYMPMPIFARMLVKQIYPVSLHVRPQAQLDYAPIPDLLHDVYGHLPFLFWPAYRHYLVRFGETFLGTPVTEADELLLNHERRMINLNNDPATPVQTLADAKRELASHIDELKRKPTLRFGLARLLHWAIEYSVVGTKEAPQVMGAIILSEFLEMRKIYAGDVAFLDRPAQMMSHHHPREELLAGDDDESQMYHVFWAVDLTHLQETLDNMDRHAI